MYDRLMAMVANIILENLLICLSSYTKPDQLVKIGPLVFLTIEDDRQSGIRGKLVCFNMTYHRKIEALIETILTSTKMETRITVGGNNSVYSSNPREGGYIELAIHGPLWAVQGHMGHSHIYTLTPPAVWTTGAAVYKTGQQRKKPHTQPPLQPQLATGDVEAGPELREGRGRKTLGEDVSELGGGRYMENPNISNSHPVTNGVQVNLHMLRPLMLNRVGGEVHGADVVAVDERALGERAVKLSQELSEPGRLSHTVSNSPVIRLSTRARDNRLSLRRRDQVAAEEDGIT
jgi:hypothetical protein